MKTMRKVRKVSGVTLVELLIATLILSIITIAMFRFYTTQHLHYDRQGQVSDMQQSARATMSILTQRVRQAGYNISAYSIPGLTDLTVIEGGSNPDQLLFAYEGKPDTLVIDSLFADASTRTLMLRERHYPRGSNVSCYDNTGPFAEGINDMQAVMASPAVLQLTVTFEMERQDSSYAGGPRLRSLDSEITLRNR
jgi:Tfp pilus assembly protein PilV